jgi:phage N-6-adenine-methyltransferase
MILRDLRNRNESFEGFIASRSEVLTLDELRAEGRASAERLGHRERQMNITSKETLSEWFDQAHRLTLARRAHHLQGAAFRQFAADIGIKGSRAFDIELLDGHRDAVLTKCEEQERQAIADGHIYRWPGWRSALAMIMPSKVHDTEPQIATLQHQLACAMRQIDQVTAEKADLENRISKMRFGKIGRGDQERETPQWLYDHFDKEFHFTCDAAASVKNHKHPHYFSKQQNALEQQWLGVIWLNPPWNEIGPFMKKAHEAAVQRDANVVSLVPLWSTEPWFLEYAIHGHIRILSDRVAFVGYDQKAPQPLCVIVFTKGSRLKADGSLHVTVERIQAPGRPKRKDNVPSIMSRGFAVS